MKTNYESLVDVVIRAEKEGKPRHELVLEIGPTPSLLVGLGVKPHRMVIKAKTVGKIFFDHCLTQRQIEKIPTMLNQPRAIFKSANPDTTNVVVLTFEFDQGAPVIIPIARDRQIGRGDVTNEVVSMYAKTGPDPVPGWLRGGLQLWSV